MYPRFKQFETIRLEAKAAGAFARERRAIGRGNGLCTHAHPSPRWRAALRLPCPKQS